MIDWKLREIELPLRFDWHIARGTTQTKKNFIVEITHSPHNAQGEVAFNSRYGESAEMVKEDFERFLEACPYDIKSLEELVRFLEDLSICSSLRFGIESAFVHYLAILSGKPVQELLGIDAINMVQTSFSIPIMDPDKIADFIKKNNLSRFHALKIKLEGASSYANVEAVLKSYEGKIRLDANESFQNPDEVLLFLEKFKKAPIEFVEQPLSAEAHNEYLYLKKMTPFPLFADESLTSNEVTSYYKERFHGVNIKLMKAGGYMKALRQIKQAREQRLKTMLGCMIETSLGISSAMNIAHRVDFFDLDGHLILEKDPYNQIEEENGRLFYSYLQ